MFHFELNMVHSSFPGTKQYHRVFALAEFQNARERKLHLITSFSVTWHNAGKQAFNNTLNCDPLCCGTDLFCSSQQIIE